VTPAEARVLELVREGKNNAEIAVRLGLSVNTVRFHVSNLLSKAGVTSREELGKWRPTASRRWTVFWLPGTGVLKAVALSAATAAAVGAAIVFSVSIGSDQDRASPDGEDDVTPGPSEDSAQPTLVDVSGRLMYDLGPVFFVENESAPVVDVELREAAAVVRLKTAGVIRLSTLATEWRVGGSGYAILQALGTIHADSRGYLNIQAADGTTLDAVLAGPGPVPDAIRVRSDRAGEGPTVIVTVQAFDDDFGGGRMYSVDVSSSGHLLVSPDTLPSQLIVDRATGQVVQIPAAHFRDAGFAGPGNHLTLCDANRCWASVGLELLESPLSGEHRCGPRGEFQVHGDQFSLSLLHLQAGEPCTLRSPVVVRKGDVLGPVGTYVISATAPDGASMSVGVTGEGALVVGEFAGTGQCPCMGFR
jgi:hypothetical protein